MPPHPLGTGILFLLNQTKQQMILVSAADLYIFAQASLQLKVQIFQQIDGVLIARHTARLDPMQSQLLKGDLYDAGDALPRITAFLVCRVELVADLTFIVRAACDISQADRSDDLIWFFFQKQPIAHHLSAQDLVVFIVQQIPVVFLRIKVLRAQRLIPLEYLPIIIIKLQRLRRIGSV